MRIAIMQPYFLPYLGYFQLLNAVDRFVLCNDFQFTKRGWVKRNRVLQNGKVVVISVPLKHGSDYAQIRERHLADDVEAQFRHLRRRLEEAYRRAPYFDEGMRLVIECLEGPRDNLFVFLQHCVRCVADLLLIRTPISVSSDAAIAQAHRGQDRVIQLCQYFGAQQYLNPPGGRDLYDAATFRSAGLDLQFLEPRLPRYAQNETAEFVPALSVVDVLMNVGHVKAAAWLAECSIVSANGASG